LSAHIRAAFQIQQDAMKTPPKSDTRRDTEKAIIKDADKTEVADRDRVHGDGKKLGLDKKS
jgi:hypothetical protein